LFWLLCLLWYYHPFVLLHGVLVMAMCAYNLYNMVKKYDP
jgi:hypothetical protein